MTANASPSHDPVLVNVMFDWYQSATDALDMRPELRKQDLVCKLDRALN